MAPPTAVRPAVPPALPTGGSRAGGSNLARQALPSTATAEPAREGLIPRSTPVPGTSRRPVNPFLSNDPNLKARRLARALVSDMVTYLPQKREEGLQNNTLKALFREEIRKSFEEYVDQVGREIADGTTHFQDALNDILAGGRKLF
jgi:hypothetical protein